jgi:[ribosomal protein S5]-alanine N-acetyltransferase
VIAAQSLSWPTSTVAYGPGGADLVAWTIPALHRVELYIEPWNAGSVKTAERARFEREGLLRSHQEIGGRRRDMLLYAAIRGSAD